MISSGNFSGTLEDIGKVATQAQIASFYLDVDSIPCVICSPIRMDDRPSMGIYSPDGSDVNFIDFGTGERGSIFTLLRKMWNTSYPDTLKRIYSDLGGFSGNVSIRKNASCGIVSSSIHGSDTDLQCRVREWRDYDIEYWESYGVPLKWLTYADVYPISHKIVVKNGHRYVFGADKYAYAYVEFKEGKTTLKIYQPYNRRGFKWANKHDKSVISLWTKVPEYGERICICSSLKDALCLWANTGIPSLAIQGEGYGMSDTAVNELKRRFKKVYILLDNDEAGLQDARKLAESTGFINVILPEEYKEKDISDLYRSLDDKEKFKSIISGLFNKQV